MATGRAARLAGFALALAVALAAAHFRVFDWADRALLDAEFQFLRSRFPQPVARDVVVVALDEATVATFPEPPALWHRHFGRFLRALALAKPSVIGLDIALPERSYDFLIPDYDKALVEGLTELRRRAPVVIAQSLDERGRLRAIFEPYVLAAGRNALGSATACPDADQVVRRLDESACGRGPGGTSLAARMAQHLGIGQEWQGWINYAIGDRIGYLPLQQVLDWLDSGDQAQLQAAFGGKPVLLGVVLPLADRYELPVALAAFEPEATLLPGVLLHAQILRSMLGPGPIRAAPEPWVLFVAAVAALFWFGPSTGWKAAGWLLCSGILLGGALWLLWQGVYAPGASFALIALLALALRLAFDSVLARRERRHLLGAFASYVNPQTLKEILKGRIQTGLAGTRRSICVMYCDIRGFTARAEGARPEAVISLLNEYFSAMTGAIHQHEGTTHQFLGDGLLALFGAPRELSNPGKSALEAAQDMLVNLARLNAALEAAGREPVRVGIGLHVGEAILGQVGGVAHQEYAAIGEVVNIAQWLDQATKELGYPIVCSAAVADAVGRAGGLTDLGERSLSGRAPMRLFGWNPPLLQTLATAQVKTA